MIEVLVKPGDTVAVEQSLITVESDKASMEIPSSTAGVVKTMRVKVGDKVAKGSAIALVQASGAAAAPAAPASAPTPAAAPAAASAATPAPTMSTPAAAPAGDRSAPTAALPAHQPGAAEAPLPHASPAIRKIARELGVPLGEVNGSGPKGRITQEDVQAFVKSVMAGATQTRAQARQGRRGAGSRQRPGRPPAVAAGRLRQVRADREEGPLAHQEDQRAGAAPQLGDDPARHQPRRCRHHRARGLPRLDQQGEREVGRQGDDARLPDQGLRGGAAEVPRLQRQPRGRPARLEEVLPHRLCRRHAERPGGAGDPRRRQEGRAADLDRDGRARQEGARRQADAEPT